MGDTASGSGGGSVLQALSAAVDLDPRRVLLRRLRQLEAARQAELAIFDRMLEHLPLELVRRIVYMAVRTAESGTARLRETTLQQTTYPLAPGPRLPSSTT